MYNGSIINVGVTIRKDGKRPTFIIEARKAIIKRDNCSVPGCRGAPARLFILNSKRGALDSLSFGRYNANEYQFREDCTMAVRGNTKQEILDAAPELLSVQGCDATSISQLAEAVGIRKVSHHIFIV